MIKPGFVSTYLPPAGQQDPAWWFVFHGDRLLVQVGEQEARLPLLAELAELGLAAVRWQYLGTLDGCHCYAAEVAEEAPAPESWSYQGLRRLFGLLPEPLFWLAGRASQVVDWDRTHQFCGRCGHLNQPKADERAKECPQCGLVTYPRISPAIIVLVEKEDA
ncbi:MAG: NADH pyrophosphatase, partial [Chloroflexi bacterium]|nr:NADH pyrophosphatase [Chloroflexota bacterium]